MSLDYYTRRTIPLVNNPGALNGFQACPAPSGPLPLIQSNSTFSQQRHPSYPSGSAGAQTFYNRPPPAWSTENQQMPPPPLQRPPTPQYYRPPQQQYSQYDYDSGPFPSPPPSQQGIGNFTSSLPPQQQSRLPSGGGRQPTQQRTQPPPPPARANVGARSTPSSSLINSAAHSSAPAPRARKTQESRVQGQAQALVEYESLAQARGEQRDAAQSNPRSKKHMLTFTQTGALDNARKDYDDELVKLCANHNIRLENVRAYLEKERKIPTARGITAWNAFCMSEHAHALCTITFRRFNQKFD